MTTRSTLLLSCVRQGNFVYASELLQKAKQDQGETYKRRLVNEFQDGTSPLHLAICLNNLEMTTLLLREGADPDMSDDHGFSPIHLSVCAAKAIARERHRAQSGRMRSDKRQSNRNKTAREERGKSKKLEIQDLAFLHLCLAHGASIDKPRRLATGENTSTPLYEAVCDGEDALATALLDHRADPNAWGHARDSPFPEPVLHVAVRKECAAQVELVKQLLKHGADPHATAATGEYSRDGPVMVDAAVQASSRWIRSLVVGVQLARNMQQAEAIAIKKSEEERALGLVTAGDW